jgi:ribonuclease HI
MSWLRRKLRGNLVFVRARPDGTVDVDAKGLVDVRYKAAPDAKVYRASAQNLEASGHTEDSLVHMAEPSAEAPAAKTKAKTARKAAKAVARPENAVIIYTDGACSVNPGPMGIGVVILRAGKERREIGAFLGHGTNNIAELTAVERALDALTPEERDLPIILHVDSQYAIGVLSQGWKAKKNTELVAQIKDKVRKFPNLSFVWVEGHAGVAENERCDVLATEAIKTGRR